MTQHDCHCGKTFLRKEHLKRHQATHENRTFTCTVCNTSFTRNDILRRHMARHDAHAAVPDSRRVRACDACHTSKTKCDGGKKCSLCAKRGIECTYYLAGTNKFFTVGAKDAARVPANLRNHAAVGGLSQFTQLISSKALLDDYEVPENDQTWIDESLETYELDFHHKWPLMHAPTFYVQPPPLGMTATVVMIASWLHSPDIRPVAITLHRQLMDTLFTDLTKPLPIKGVDSWPTDLYQIAILNIVFAMYLGDSDLISRAALLKGLLITAMRQIGYFNRDNLEDERLTHFPGDFAPYKLSIIERWKRTVSVLFKADTYISLLSFQAPQLQANELQVAIPSTWTLWNAHGMDVWFKRHAKEPDRSLLTYTFGLQHIQSISPEGVLVEDAHIGLCSLYNDIWQRQNAQSDSSTNFILPFQLSSQVIEHTLQILDTINTSNANDQSALRLKQLLTLYLARPAAKDSDDWKAAASQVRSHIAESTIFSHILHLLIFSDVQAMNTKVDLDGGLLSEYQRNLEKVQSVGGKLQQWANISTDGPATRNALEIVKIAELNVRRDAASRGPDPLADFAIVMSALVIFTWLTHTQRPCTCAADMPASFNDHMPLCICSITRWKDRFRALAKSCTRQDMSKRITDILQLSACNGASVEVDLMQSSVFT